MPADQPTILATSGGFVADEWLERRFGPLLHYAVDLAGVTGRTPRVCMINTAGGDQAAAMHSFDEAARVAGFQLSHLKLFSMPNVPDIAAHLNGQDVIWVGGGSVANLLAVWQVHGLGEILRDCWQAGVVLSGVSAGSICWHVGGSTDSFGPQLRAVTNGLAFLPYGNGVHYDSERRRRPTIHDLVARQVLPDTYCTDDGVGLLYRGTEMAEALTERDRAGAYLVRRAGEGVQEERIEPRRLPAVPR
ncbi:MAG: peptidase E [Micrococcales bacterium]|nr:MAG: peptidase E [Micrococcales bacterium]PIE26409.1 MAG: peptidase E [Micrococcales bacterium]